MTEITFRNAKMVAGQLIIDIPYEHRGSVMNFILTLCPRCHGMYDQGIDRKNTKIFLANYLKSKYPDWDEDKLIYKKGM